MLVGLSDESVPVTLVCPPSVDIDSLISPTVEIIRYPALELPFMGWRNKTILVESLKKFKPSVLHCLCETQAELARYVSRELELPYVLTVNSLHERFRRLSISASRLAAVTVPAETIAADLAERYRQFADKIELVNVGTFTAETISCFHDTSRLTSIVAAGPAFNTAQELEIFLRAVKRLVIEQYEFMLIIVGGKRGNTVEKIACPTGTFASRYHCAETRIKTNSSGRWRYFCAAKT